MTDSFWSIIDQQIAALRTAASADDVMSILSVHGRKSDVGFFGGSGGDDDVASVLFAAGWTVVWMPASYHWSMRSPDGASMITYVEDDVYRGSR